MSDDDKQGPGLLSGTKSGVGWAVGFSTVMGIGSVLRQGSSPTVKAAIKMFLRTRHTLAEATESARDLYAEAKNEYQADAAPSPDASSNGQTERT